MRTTIELPDDLMEAVRRETESKGITLRTFFISAAKAQLEVRPKKPRLEPPVVPGGAGIANLTREEIDEIAFG